MTAAKKRAKVSAIEAKLAYLSELQEELTAKNAKLDKLIDQVFAENPKAQAKRERIEAQIESVTDILTERITDVKDAVIVLGETVKGENLQAVWSKGKTSWNTNQLLGFAKAHKEVLEMKKEGNPSISIRKVAK